MQLRRVLIVALVVAVFAAALAVGIVELVKRDRAAAAPYQIQLVSGPIDTTSFPDITNTTQDPFPDSWYGRIRTWWNTHTHQMQQLKDDSEYVFLLHLYHPALTITQFSPDEEHIPLSFTTIKTYIESKMDVKIGDYVPRSTFLVVCTPPVARNLSSLLIPLSTFNTSFPSNVSLSSPFTLYVIPFPDAAKLTGTLLEWNDAQTKQKSLPNDQQKDTRLTIVLLPRTWTKDETDALATEWNFAMKTSNFGARVIVQNETLDHVYVIIDGITTPQHILTIAQWFSHQSQVMIIERQEHFQLFNINAQWIIQTGDKPAGDVGTGQRPYWEAGIFGQGQIVGAADSGLDWDHCFFADPTQPAGPSTSVNPNARKVISYQPLADRTDEVAGHGTHVVGSIAGNPLSAHVTKVPALENYRGMAPQAKIYFQDVGDSSGSLSGLAGDLYTTIFQPAYRAGARIHSNSWGSSERYYTTNAQTVDRFVWDNPDMLLIFAAGNDGVTAGSVSGNTGSPATAKNILSVGAEQTSNNGFLDALKYVNWEEKRIAAARQLKQPISTFDCCASSNRNVKAYCCQAYVQQNIDNSQYFNYENMAAFSSRGPTADGRVKPEIVAPGSQVISSQSDGRITGVSGNTQCNTLQTALLAMEGTSMATPVVAGAAALVRQYLVEGWYPSGAPKDDDKIVSPRASVIAAIMLASTRSLTGFIDKDNTNDYQSLQGLNYPLNVFQGFGKLELDNALYLASSGPNARRLYIDYSRSIQTGQDINYCVTTTATTYIHAVLVYHDRPAQPNSDPALVNNLDLIVGRTPDDALAGNFVTNRDEKNNAEHVIFPQNGNIGAGQTVYVRVRGWNIPAGPQPYSLALAGHFDPAQVKSGPSCSASDFIISQERFAAATESQYFPYGPVVGGVAGGLTFLGLLAILARFCYQKYMT